MEKTKLELLAICDYAAMSQDNKLSIMGMFEQMFVTSLPSQHPQMFIVGIFDGNAGQTEELTLEIKTPSGADALLPQKMNMTLGQNGKSNLIATINSLPISEVGFYKIRLSNRVGVIGEKEFGVFMANQPDMKPKSSNKYTN